ncbi:hypothetical protein VTK26DRAFT_350 [Humicola hyalothermophila]
MAIAMVMAVVIVIIWICPRPRVVRVAVAGVAGVVEGVLFQRGWRAKHGKVVHPDALEGLAVLGAGAPDVTGVFEYSRAAETAPGRETAFKRDVVVVNGRVAAEVVAGGSDDVLNERVAFFQVGFVPRGLEEAEQAREDDTLVVGVNHGVELVAFCVGAACAVAGDVEAIGVQALGVGHVGRGEPRVPVLSRAEKDGVIRGPVCVVVVWPAIRGVKR